MKASTLARFRSEIDGLRSQLEELKTRVVPAPAAPTAAPKPRTLQERVKAIADELEAEVAAVDQMPAGERARATYLPFIRDLIDLRSELRRSGRDAAFLRALDGRDRLSRGDAVWIVEQLRDIRWDKEPQVPWEPDAPTEPLTLRERVSKLEREIRRYVAKQDALSAQQRQIGAYQWVRREVDPIDHELQRRGFHIDALDLAKMDDNTREEVMRAAEALRSIRWEEDA